MTVRTYTPNDGRRFGRNGGRPPVHGVPRDRTITVRVTRQQHDAFVEVAKRLRLTVGDAAARPADGCRGDRPVIGTEHLVVRIGARGQPVLERWEAGYLGPLNAQSGLPIIARYPLQDEHAGMSLDQLRNIYDGGGFDARASLHLDPGVA